MRESLLGIIGATIASIGIVGSSADASIAMPKYKPCLDRSVILQSLDDNMGNETKKPDNKKEGFSNNPEYRERIVYEPVLKERIFPRFFRGYNLRDFVQPGTYEVRLKVMYGVTTAHEVFNNVKELPYLEFINTRDKSHIIKLALNDMDKERKFSFFVYDNKKCSSTGVIDLNDKIYPYGKVITTIKPDDVYLRIYAPEKKIILPPNTKKIYEKIEKEDIDKNKVLKTLK
jgi:hypothetical protein